LLGRGGKRKRVEKTPILSLKKLFPFFQKLLDHAKLHRQNLRTSKNLREAYKGDCDEENS